MGQQEILDFLKEHPKQWFSTIELSEKLNIGKTSVGTSIKKMINTGFLEWSMVPRGKKPGARGLRVVKLSPSFEQKSKKIGVRKNVKCIHTRNYPRSTT